MRIFKYSGNKLADKGPLNCLSVDCSGTSVAVCGCSIQIYPVSSFREACVSPSSQTLKSVTPIHKIDCHKSSPINAVKFSPTNGSLLSGSADGKVYLNKNAWEDTSSPILILDLYSDEFAEQAKMCNSSFVKRKQDDDDDSVMDISWSSDGLLAAVVSLNSKVVILDMINCKIVGVLTNFKSSVKSIAFDPNNRFLVAISNDKIVYVYQYRVKMVGTKLLFHAKIVHSISKLLQKSFLTSKFSKFNWAPGGNLVAIPNSTKEVDRSGKKDSKGKDSGNPPVINLNSTNLSHTYSLDNVTTISMLSPLNSFTNILSLIGHKFSTLEVVKFNPKLFKITKPTTAPPPPPLSSTPNSISDMLSQNPQTVNRDILNDKYHGIIATGGLDDTLVIWSTIIEKPIFVGVDFSEKPIVDLDWTPDGLSLFVASLDGIVSFLQFEEEELGKFASFEEKTKMKFEIVKKIKPLEEPASWRVSDEAKVKFTENGKSNEKKEVKSKKNDPKSEVKSESGTERIIIDVDDKDDDDNDGGNNEEPNGKKIQNGDDNKSKDIEEKQNKEGSIKLKDTENVKSKETEKVKSKEKDAGKTIYKKPTITKSGKKRVSTILVTSYGNDNTDALTKRATSSKTAPASVSNTFDKPANSVPKSITVSNAKRHKDSTDDDDKLLKKSKVFEPTEFVKSTIVDPNTAFAKLRLGVPKAALNISYSSPTDKSLSLVVKNGSGNEQKPTKLSLVRHIKNDDDSKEYFADFASKLVNLVAGGESHYWAVAALDGTVFVYSMTGKRLLPPLVLGSSISFLECNKEFLMAVTTIGDLYVWNIKEKKAVFKPTNMYSLFEASNKYQDELIVRGDNITLCAITAKGIPLVTLSCGTGYLYDPQMSTWCLVSDSWWVFGSQYWDSLANSGSFGASESSSALSLLESKTNEEVLRRKKTNLLKAASKVMLLKGGYENLETSVSLAHLENRMLVCERLGEKEEFKKHILTYCVKLSELAYKSKLIEVFQDLLGPDDSEKDITWKSTVCGIDKHELLKEMVLGCAKCRAVQRILISYGKAIGVLEQDILGIYS